MAFASYDFSQVIFVMGGSPVTGFADGTGIEVEFDEQQWQKVTGADGLTQRAKTNNYAGSITITLLNGSNGNDLLNAFWQADRLGNSGNVPVLIKDNSGRTLWAAENGWVQQMPTQSFSKDNEERSWIIDCDALVGVIGGNQPLA